jgi:hypothetical protein
MANMPFFLLIAGFVHSLFRSRHQLIFENLALRQQVAMLRQSVKKPRPSVADKFFWIVFSRYVDGWRKILCSLHPDTVVRWHRQGFRFYWRWKSRNRLAEAVPRVYLGAAFAFLLNLGGLSAQGIGKLTSPDQGNPESTIKQLPCSIQRTHSS